MPAQVADWSEVKAFALSCGNLKQAADTFGIEYTAVRVRAHREKWPVGRRLQKNVTQAKETLQASIAKNRKTSVNSNVTPVTTASEALIVTLADYERRTKIALAKASAKGAEHVAESQGDEVVAAAADLKSLAGVAAVAHGWNGGNDVTRGKSASILVNIGLVMSQLPAGAVEIEAEVIQDAPPFSEDDPG